VDGILWFLFLFLFFFHLKEPVSLLSERESSERGFGIVSIITKSSLLKNYIFFFLQELSSSSGFMVVPGVL